MPDQSNIALEAEQKAFDETARAIEEWWSTPRQRHIKRPYSARAIAALRGSETVPCVSSPAALKLWAMLCEHRRNGTAEMTFGATDPVAVSQMAKHMRTVYVSGGLCGFSENNYPGMDHADYLTTVRRRRQPWDTVPKVVDKIFRSELWHDQRQYQFRMSHRLQDRSVLEKWDYLMPIIADGDMGFGSLTTTLKSTKALAEFGAAGIHIDDLAIGLKKFTIGQGRTIVPTSEYVDRVKAMRLQLDIMGAETLIFARCDTDHADYITSVVDPRDHEYVLGATRDVRPLQQVVSDAIAAGESVLDARSQWIASAGLKTFDETVQAVATEAQFDAYKLDSRVSYGSSLRQRREAARDVTGADVTFDWELPRSSNGQYMFRQTVKTIVERALLVAPLSDLSWSRMDSPNYHDIKEYHETMLSYLPSRMFAFAWGGEWSFPQSAGWTPERRKNASAIMAKDFGVVWQVQPMYMIQGVNMEIERSADMWTSEGIGGYYEKIQAAAISRKPFKVDGYEKMSWCGGSLSDAFFAAVAGEEISQI
ncbi:isocitrate lyase [Penicillium riverlandense]|uniref:isocitrate lyase n=1 Tax=Penicillium riverlandense TaxID=1903569 RepID=UPI002546BC3E|nr:isocitrate lyase [Penicillium riverlandense]KAJ5805364.1 isocitrate lyase [Penicillium riverlandense]